MQHSPAKPASSTVRRLSAWWLVLALLPLCTGCSGCRPSPMAGKSAADILKEQEEREKKRREAEKLPIELGTVQILPSDDTEPQFYVKPGHIVSTRQMVRANFEDVQSDFISATVNSEDKLYELEHVPYLLQFERPAALPKGQAKVIEANYFVPRGRDTLGTGTVDRAWLRRTFRPRGGNFAEVIDKQPVISMPEHQYHFVILAETPDSYGFVRSLHSIKPPEDSFSDETPTIYYRVQIPADPRQGVALPSQAFGWTSIAYVIWDNIQPNMLTPDQQQALLDWLHWGGQLIISGPGSLEKLSGSFLEPYLPAAREAGIELRQEDFDELNRYWTLIEKKKNEPRNLVVQRTSLSGVRLSPAPLSRFVVGTGTLVCEGDVGRGRVAITAFPLTDRDVINWGCFESFFHNALLRRPPRFYQASAYGDVLVAFANRPSLTHDGRLGSGLRYFSRDVAAEAPAQDQGGSSGMTTDAGNTSPTSSSALASPSPPPLTASGQDGLLLDLTGYASPPQSGSAGWNDFSAASNAARDSLKLAAGITIPGADFVWKVIAVYLLVLVPVNWTFFRLLGRVEWAWLTAPVLAVIASIIVVRLAQLDIGFARSRTEVATLEIQTGYPRAHLTRYTALYTSLSTPYEMEFEDPSAVVAPFSSEPAFVRRAYDKLPEVKVRRDRHVRLSGFAVESNSTGMVHSEQMYDLQGSLSAESVADGQWRIHNGTAVTLRDAFLVGRSAEGAWIGARLGDLAPQRLTEAATTVFGTQLELGALWQDSPVLGERQVSDDEQTDRLSLGWLRHVATFDAPLAPGDLRLIAWSDEDWAGLTILPEANQTKTSTLVVAHLRRGPRLEPKPDVNLYSDVRSEVKADNEESPVPVPIPPQNNEPCGD